MRYLLDTGILVRIPHRTDPLHQQVRLAISHLTTSGHTLLTTRQNMAEFWNVCTRPASARGGFGLTADAARRLRLLERFITVLAEPDSAYSRWKALVLRYGVLGRQVHDARIVAVMAAYRIKRIITLNEADFVRYAEITPYTPATVLA